VSVLHLLTPNKPAVEAMASSSVTKKALDEGEAFAGTTMIKYCKKPNKQPHRRQFKFEVDRRLISWRSAAKRTTILVDDIKEVRRGQKTEAFSHFPWPEKEESSFSIIYGANFISLDLICDTKEVIQPLLPFLFIHVLTPHPPPRELHSNARSGSPPSSS